MPLFMLDNKRQIASIQRISGFMRRKQLFNWEKELEYALRDDLVEMKRSVGCKGSKAGVEQDSYRIPEKDVGQSGTHASTACCPALFLAVVMAPGLITCDDPLHESGVFVIPKQIFAVLVPYAVPFAGRSSTLSIEIARDDSVCLAWPGLWSSPTLSVLHETGTPFSDKDLSKTHFSHVNKMELSTDQRQNNMNTQKERKALLIMVVGPPLTELQTVCGVGWMHRGYEQLVMEYEAILRGERSLMRNRRWWRESST
ncbi:zinc finger MYND domain-containing protein 11 [Trichonephila clavipes]|nr:zinc finger MYND domain-containing protein 11 [Trichonephila clavipes]